MAEVKVRKKDIQEAKQPDAVLEGATSVFDWIVEKKNLVIGALVALLVVVAVATIVSNRSDAQFRDVGGDLGNAVALLDRPVIEKADGKADDKSFPSKDAKQKAVDEAFGKIAKDHAGSKAAVAADLVLAQQAYDAGKYDDAIQQYQNYISKDGKEGLALFAYEGLGYAYEAKGDLAKAEENFQKLADVGAPGRALYHKGRILEKQGKKDDARKAYQDVVSGFEKETIASEARTRLDLLDMPAGGGNLEAPAPAPAEEPKPGKKPAKKAAPK